MKNRIAAAREALGYGNDQIGFAKLLGVSQSAVSRWEKGDYVPAKTKIAAFERVGINSQWLETGEGPMFLPHAEALSDEIAEIIGIYKRLTPKQRALLNSVAKQFLDD